MRVAQRITETPRVLSPVKHSSHTFIIIFDESLLGIDHCEGRAFMKRGSIIALCVPPNKVLVVEKHLPEQSRLPRISDHGDCAITVEEFDIAV